MADAILSAAAERLIALLEEQALHQINLVRGAEEKLRSLAVDLQTIRIVLDDAENRRFKDKKINYWLSRLEQAAYEMEDILDEWDYALLKSQVEEHRSKAIVAAPKQMVCSFLPSSSCLCFKKVAFKHNIGKKILGVKAKLDDILKERDQYDFVISQPTVDPLPESWRVQSSSMIDLTKVHGRDADRDILVTKLMDNGGSQEESGFRILSIVGTGGLGKTTLAQMSTAGVALRIWVCVSDPFDLAAIVKGILESIKVGSSPNTNHLDVLFKRRIFHLSDVSFIRCGGAGSKILVTSRSERVVKMMGSRESEICRPGLLSDEDCWLLLCRTALSERNNVEFEDIGKKIAKKCKGLPLAAKTLGSLLRFKSSLEQWSNVLNSEIWQMEEAEVDFFPPFAFELQ
ncbi:hypothetical protein ACS0TY_033059 [Phlomoides rotata]